MRTTVRIDLAWAIHHTMSDSGRGMAPLIIERVLG